MTRYLISRLAGMAVTLWLVSLAAFWISTATRIDPALSACDGDRISPAQYALCLERTRKRYHLDQPLFYFELAAAAEPDTLARIWPLEERDAARYWVLKTGHWEQVNTWRLSLASLRRTLSAGPILAADAAEALARLAAWASSKDAASSNALVTELDGLLTGAHWPETTLAQWARTRSAYDAMTNSAPGWARLAPKLIIHGPNCRYHIWLMGLLRGDLGKSQVFNRQVGPFILERAATTAPLVLFGFLLSVFLGAGIGLRAGRQPGGTFDRWSGPALFALDALPSFYVAVILLVCFANPSGWHLFPSTFHARYLTPWESLTRWVLPLIAFSYGSLAAIARNVRAIVADALKEDYSRTARAKGLSEKECARRHAFPAAFPLLIQISAGLLPSLVGGTIVIEQVFGINGLGASIIEACMENDVIFLAAIFTLTALLTSAGYLLADLGCAWVDPRIRFKSNAA